MIIFISQGEKREREENTTPETKEDAPSVETVESDEAWTSRLEDAMKYHANAYLAVVNATVSGTDDALERQRRLRFGALLFAKYANGVMKAYENRPCDEKGYTEKRIRPFQ